MFVLKIHISGSLHERLQPRLLLLVLNQLKIMLSMRLTIPRSRYRIPLGSALIGVIKPNDLLAKSIRE